jgi:hypothetical protein
MVFLLKKSVVYPSDSSSLHLYSESGRGMSRFLRGASIRKTAAAGYVHEKETVRQTRRERRTSGPFLVL